MGEEALTALLITLPPYYVRNYDLRCPVSEKCLQLQIHLATLTMPSKRMSWKSLWAAPETIWWFLGQLIKAGLYFHCLGPGLTLLLAFCSNPTAMRSHYCCFMFLQPKVKGFSTRIPRLSMLCPLGMWGERVSPQSLMEEWLRWMAVLDKIYVCN